MKILGIETSCDETAIALLEVNEFKQKINFKILTNEISSQANLHAQYGGVFPALAKREHQINLPIVFEKVLKDTKTKIENIDLITVTTGPGLEPALWTGIVFAEELHKKHKIPIIPVNHMEGHIFSIFPKKTKTFTINLNDKIFPILSLLVSGGHTELVVVNDWPFNKSQDKHTYKKIGKTRDDAAGEAFDKVARMLGLPYPGGPAIGKLAEEARNKNMESDFSFPRPMINSKDYDFSFSGLKTAVLYYLRDNKKINKNLVAREFEDAVTETLVSKTIKAIKEYKTKTLIVGGGVSASKNLRDVIKNNIKIEKLKIKIHFPPKGLTGDNALMIAIAGYFQYKNKKLKKNHSKLIANGNLSL